MNSIWDAFMQGMLDTPWCEAIAGWVLPVSGFPRGKSGLSCWTNQHVIYVFLSLKGDLGEASVNLYYTIRLLWLVVMAEKDRKNIR
jgi:hypothetical protein